jgi:hypothetical protein
MESRGGMVRELKFFGEQGKYRLEYLWWRKWIFGVDLLFKDSWEVKAVGKTRKQRPPFCLIPMFPRISEKTKFVPLW